jgi:hypothetical protein
MSAAAMSCDAYQMLGESPFDVIFAPGTVSDVGRPAAGTGHTGLMAQA